jgi:hypothetical protein
MRIPRSSWFAVGAVVTFAACSDDSSTGTESTSTGAGAGEATASSGSGFTGGNGMGGAGSTTVSTGTVLPPPTAIAECQGHVYECGDLVDNDADGLVDYQDPDCLGPCDDTEDSYYGGIPGQMGPPCTVDCYWDQDSGPGNDDCYWDHRCDPNEVPPNYYPEPDNGAQCEYQGPDYVVAQGMTCAELQAAQSNTCGSVCGPLTPNGCDCFGCCELPAGSGQFVWSGSVGADGTTVCTLAEIQNPAVCHPCVPVNACFNECDPCELCVGKPQLDPGCTMGPECDPGVQACGQPGLPACPAGFYCITGCCIAEPQ